MRASDEDREQLITELRDHSVAGRLDTDELERRVSAAYEARTTGSSTRCAAICPCSASTSPSSTPPAAVS
ncbi:MAG TPA: DUF1707 domain-containing protein [Solirubrobacteraceae bacterium]